MAGLFITVSGGDGGGKSTVLSVIEKCLANAGRTAVMTGEPGGTSFGVQVRSLVLLGEDLNPVTEALLFAADRAHHVATVIRPALERGDDVVSSRYADDSVAYQCATGELDPDVIWQLSMWATGNLVPDVTFLLDLDPTEGLARVGGRGEKDRMESKEIAYHDRVRSIFLGRARHSPDRFVVVDASQPIEKVAADVAESMTRILRGGAQRT